ncbi:MAG TPA: glycosyltransferase [Pseudoxanthomonas sp.]|nr:glycosyltransferase [Pseudoxanthomonas sp.]
MSATGPLQTGNAQHQYADPEHGFIVPAYGASPYLRECLDSLRAQTRPSPILISTSTPWPGLADLANEYGARLAIRSPNAGIGRDWNTALAHANTSWVTLAHQDDIYLPRFTELTLAAASTHADTQLVMTGYGEVLDGVPRTRTAMLAIKRLLLELGYLGRDHIASRAAKRRLLRFGCPIPCPSVTLRVSPPGLRFREDLKVNLDWEAWLRLADQPGAFARVRECAMLHRIHAASETSEGVRAGVRAREDLMMFESLWPAPVARLLARAYALSYPTGNEA